MHIDLEKIKKLPSDVRKEFYQTFIKYEEKKKEATLLKLSCDKALAFLNWQSNLNFEETVNFTIDWYRNFYDQKILIFDKTCEQINEYIQLAKSRKLTWAE